ncbi:hypothetical protein Cgig2_020392 [Carnegiea gigantea]|uniref:Uncharacterized protein n=1 Tax=Carnegiea gigantea TaxID=171969 RepID=A0A9Q1K6P4_9CARY|nr:hypothetical protein Cgig2_020392 [Carnegiea gigantea]
MAVVVPVAVAGGPDDGVGGIHGTLGHSEEELLTKTKPRTEQTTAAESSSTSATGDAPIHQGGHNMCALMGAVHTAEEPITVRAVDTLATVHGTGPPLLRMEDGNRWTMLSSKPMRLRKLPQLEGRREETADVVIADDAAEEVPSATTKVPTKEVHDGPRPCPSPLTRTCDRYIQNIVEDNHRISYNVRRHTMTGAVTSTYAMYHNHECGVPRYAVQV